MNLRTFFLALTAGCCLIAIRTLADVPHLINFQGTLTDSSGSPINDVIGRMTFSIYADSVGGNDLCSETHREVAVVDGLFRVNLGAVHPLPSSVFNGDVLWLGIIVSPDALELSPRQRIVTLPYGFKFLHSDLADYAVLLDGSSRPFSLSRQTFPHLAYKNELNLLKLK